MADDDSKETASAAGALAASDAGTKMAAAKEATSIELGALGNDDEKRPAGMSVYTGKRQSYQMRALVRKTLSYQKQQWCTNICCVACCPLLLVTICGIIGVIVTSLVSNLAPGSDVQFCSNGAAIDPMTMLPGSDFKKDADGRSLYPVGRFGRCTVELNTETFTSLPYVPPSNTSCSPTANPELCPIRAAYESFLAFFAFALTAMCAHAAPMSPRRRPATCRTRSRAVSPRRRSTTP